MKAKDNVKLTEQEAQMVSGGLTDKPGVDAAQQAQEEIIKSGKADKIYDVR